MRDVMSVLMEGILDEKLDQELGYSKYDYWNKETDNSRNGHSKNVVLTVRNCSVWVQFGYTSFVTT